MEKTIKMYLESNPGFNCLLITDGEKWLCFNESQLPVALDCYTIEENAEIIKAAITSGDLYDAEDFWSYYSESDDQGNEGDENRFYIKEYNNKTIDDIDHLINYKIDPVSGIEYPITSDRTSWLEIK